MGKELEKKKKIWVFPLCISSLVGVLLLFGAFFNMELVSSIDKLNLMLPHNRTLDMSTMIDSGRNGEQVQSLPQPLPAGPIPRFAYLVAGSKGDVEKVWRVVNAIYHPRNQYVVHLDLESPAWERLELAYRIRNHGVFSRIGNVFMITKANMVTYRGPTMLSTTLHACAILLRKNNHWDWFINLSASDYPLVTQDDILYVFSSVNRSLNFIHHSRRLGWKAPGRAKPMIIDHGLDHITKQSLTDVKLINRKLPTAFTLFTGSAWMGLSRAFVEYCIMGWDNLPRTLLMYYTNFVSTPEGYFHTVICNVPEFVQTIVNNDLHYISWDRPPRQHPRTFTLEDTTKMIASNAPFARKFKQNDEVLDKIDKDLLSRANGSFTPGAWCSNYPICSIVGNISHVKPGPGAQRLHRLVTSLVAVANRHRRQCTSIFI